MNLLKWQTEALDVYKLHDGSHFVIVAGTGLGKTTLGTACAQFTFAKSGGQSPFVVVGCPSRSIKRGWKKTMRKAGLRVTTNNNDAGDPDYDGCALTFSGLKTAVKSIKELGRPVIIIYDEFHHLEENGDWVKPFVDLIEDRDVSILKHILLSGTPWHETGTLPECIVTYNDDGIVNHDVYYKYGDNVVLSGDMGKERNVVPVEFHEINGTAFWEKRDIETGEVSEEGCFDTLAVDGDGVMNESTSITPFVDFGEAGNSIAEYDAVLELVDSAVRELREQRHSSQTYAGGLFIVRRKGEARELKKYLHRTYGITATMVVSDDPNAHDQIEAFDNDHSKEWLIAVDMVSEGVDVPRIKVLGDLTNKLTLLHIIQRWGRALRRVRKSETSFYPNGVAHIYYIAHPKLVRVASEIEEEINQARRNRREDGGEGTEHTTTRHTVAQESHGERIKFSNEYYERITDRLARWMWDTNYMDVQQGRRAYVDALFIARVLADTAKTTGEWPRGFDAVEPEKDEPELAPDPDEVKAELISNCDRHLRKLTAMELKDFGNDYPAAAKHVWSQMATRLKLKRGEKWNGKNKKMAELREYEKHVSALCAEYGVDFNAKY